MAPAVNYSACTAAGFPSRLERRPTAAFQWLRRRGPLCWLRKELGNVDATAPRAVREIAWKAQMRLCGRFRSLTRKGKRPTVVATAIARELSAFIWAINREVVGSHATANQ